MSTSTKSELREESDPPTSVGGSEEPSKLLKERQMLRRTLAEELRYLRDVPDLGTSELTALDAFLDTFPDTTLSALRRPFQSSRVQAVVREYFADYKPLEDADLGLSLRTLWSEASVRNSVADWVLDAGAVFAVGFPIVSQLVAKAKANGHQQIEVTAQFLNRALETMKRAVPLAEYERVASNYRGEFNRRLKASPGPADDLVRCVETLEDALRGQLSARAATVGFLLLVIVVLVVCALISKSCS